MTTLAEPGYLTQENLSSLPFGYRGFGRGYGVII